MNITCYNKLLFIFGFGSICTGYYLPADAQDTLDIKKESAYYHTYFQHVIARIYTERKYTSFSLNASGYTGHLKYKPNTYNALGAGITYRSLTIDLAYGFGFLFNDKNKGKTHVIDLQTRLYVSKWAVDGFIKSYGGFYLASSSGLLSLENPGIYIRPDIKLRLFGASAFRLFHGKGFSLRPAFVQDVKQKKSGGTFQAGGEWFFTHLQGDSSIIPARLLPAGSHSFSYANMLQIGPGGGYAYTKVFPHNFFATADLTGNININLFQEAQNSHTSIRTGLNINLHYRLAVGYDTGDYSICAYVMNNRISYKGDVYNYTVNSGSFKCMIAKRFKTTRTIKKYVNFFNHLVD